MLTLHTLDAFATWQGGFDYYFAHVASSEWGVASDALKAQGLNAAAQLFDQARAAFEHVVKTDFADEANYLAQMRELDKRWREHVPALHAILAEWRKENGLEEFGAPGW